MESPEIIISSEQENFFEKVSLEEGIAVPKPLIGINIIYSEPNVSEELQEVLQEQKKYLFDLAGIAIAYIQRQSSTNAQAIYDTQLWETVFSKLPLMGTSKFSTFNFSSSATRDIANALINPRGTILILIEAVKVGNKIELVPKIKTSFFSTKEQDFQQLIRVVRTGQQTSINCKYQEATSMFNYGALKNEQLKEDFENFVNNSPKEDVRRWNNFFIETNSAV